MRLNTVLIVGLLAYVVIQLVYVIFFPLPFTSDSAASMSFAQMAIQEHTYYPNPSSLFGNGIIAPVYTNYLILILLISNSVQSILFSNILLNTLQLVLLFKVTEKLFGTRAAIAAGILYALYLNNVGLVLLNLTELPFGLCILASLYFYLSSPTIRNYLLCGFAMGLAIGVRPTGLALTISFLIVYVVYLFQNKAQHLKMACIVIGMFLYIVPMGLLSKQNIDRFEYSSASGPANIIMSANPRATGVFDPYIFKNDSILLAKKTYVEKNEYLLNSAKEYLKEHPGHWFSLIPRKLYSTFVSDVWAIPQVLHAPEWDLNVYIKGKAGARERFHEKSVFFRIAFWILNGWQQMIYGVIFVFFFYQLFSFLKGKDFSIEKLLINLFIAGGMGITIVASVGNPRYKYSFLMIAIILVSPYIIRFLDTFIFPMFTRKQFR